MNLEQKVLINGRYVSIFFTYHDDESGKDYIAYTDETKDVNGKLNIYYGYYKTVDNNIVIDKIDSKEEEKKILEIFNIIMEESK